MNRFLIYDKIKNMENKVQETRMERYKEYRESILNDKTLVSSNDVEEKVNKIKEAAKEIKEEKIVSKEKTIYDSYKAKNRKKMFFYWLCFILVVSLLVLLLILIGNNFLWN